MDGASVQCRVSPLTPSMCNPVAFDFKPQEAVSNLGPTGQISCYESNRTRILGSPFHALAACPLYCILARGDILAFRFMPRASVSNLGPLVQILFLIIENPRYWSPRIESSFLAKLVVDSRVLG